MERVLLKCVIRCSISFRWYAFPNFCTQTSRPLAYGVRISPKASATAGQRYVVIGLSSRFAPTWYHQADGVRLVLRFHNFLFVCLFVYLLVFFSLSLLSTALRCHGIYLCQGSAPGTWLRSRLKVAPFVHFGFSWSLGSLLNLSRHGDRRTEQEFRPNWHLAPCFRGRATHTGNSRPCSYRIVVWVLLRPPNAK